MRPPDRAPGEKEGTYQMTYRCDNCGVTELVSFKWGELAPKYLERPCNNCGCETLVKVK